MAGRRGAGIPAGHEDVEAGIVAVKHPSGGTHVGKRAEHHGRIVGAHGAPQLHGPFAIELAMHPTAQLPATVHAARHQVVLRPAQRSVSKETKECGHRQRGRITFDGAEVQSQQCSGDLPSAPVVPAAATTARFVLRFVDLERAATEIAAVQRLHGLLRIRVRHFYEAETARLAGIAIVDQCDFLDSAVLGE